MAAAPPYVSPRALAEALGVSESSVKRWADGGRIEIARTGGGHRRIPLAEAIRFVRESRLEVVRPERLGLDARVVASGEALEAAVVEGRVHDACALASALYLAGESVGAICDGPIARAVTHVGELWCAGGDEGIFIEHRATALAISVLAQLRVVLPPAKSDLVAIGGGLSGDPSQLPSLMAAVVLEGQGVRTLDLGPHTPPDTLRLGVERTSAGLVWISVNHVGDPVTTGRQLESLVSELVGRGVEVILGGSGLPRTELRSRDGVLVASSMVEMEAFARGLVRRGSVRPEHG